MNEQKPLKFRLNGKEEIVIHYDLDWKLLDLLREHFKLTAVKNGCAPHGQCGCCTVIYNNKPRTSCTIPIDKIENAEIVTLEGLDGIEKQIIAHSFVECGSIQCGFCIPGIVVRTKKLLDENDNPSREEIKKALDSHICRCTGYKRIIDGIELASKHWKKKTVPKLNTKGGIGKDIPKYDGINMAYGTKPYTCDVMFDGMLHGVLLLSPMPRVKIIEINTEEAERQEGVVKVFTAKDVPGERVQGLITKDWPVFIDEGEITHFVGSYIALLVAETEAIARRSIDLIKVKYEEAPAIFSIDEALRNDTVNVHPSGNLLATTKIKRGDLVKALNESDHVINEVFETQYIEHAFLEPECSVARTLEDGRLEVFSQGQGVFDDRRQIASMLNLKEHDVIVHLMSTGGGFGGKEDITVQAHASLAAYHLKRPVKVAFNRKESIFVHPKRHPMRLEYTIGFTKDGYIKAVKARIYGDTGAHASVGAKVVERAAGHSCSAYRVDNVDIESYTVYTNNVPCGAMRGFGVNQSAFAFEGLLNRISEITGIDGWEIRYRNALSEGDRFCTGQKMHSIGLRRTLEEVKDVYYTSEYAGIACGIKNVGIGNGMDDIGRVQIAINIDGSIDVVAGFTEMGQGLFTVVQQIICEELGLTSDQINVKTSTVREVNSGMTTASRGTVLTTNALHNGINKIKEDLKTVNTLKELAGKEYYGEYICDFTSKPEDNVDDPITHLSYGFATQVVILDRLGNIAKIVASHDVGRIINPKLLAGQIEGAIHMGLGFALTEELIVENGIPIKPKLRNLNIIKPSHMPEVEVSFIEESEKNNFYGAKGVGEIGLVPTAGAVSGAIYSYERKHHNKTPMRDSIIAKRLLNK